MKRNCLIKSLLVLLCTFSWGAKAQRYEKPEDVFKAPVSQSFGFRAGYQPRNHSTLYRVVKPAPDNRDDLTQAWFDISNNNINCAVNAAGLIEYPTVLGPLKEFHTGASGSDSDYLTGSPWSLSLHTDKHKVLLSEIENPSLEIVENVLYKWIYRLENLQVEMLLIAPEAEEDPVIPEPRALIMVLRLSNSGKSALNGIISVPEGITDALRLGPDLERAQTYGPAVLPVANSHRGSRANFHPRWAEVAPTTAGYEAVTVLDSTFWAPSFPDVSFNLKPGGNKILTFAYMVGGSYQELNHTRDFIRSKSVMEWVNSTLEVRRKATGKLVIPEDTTLTEMFVRYYECAHNCFILNGNGILKEPKGGAWSVMSILNPAYVCGSLKDKNRTAELVPFHSGSILSDISFSLSGSTQELILAADYFQRTGDLVFIQCPEFRKKATMLINSILLTRYPDVALFPSKHIWDGPSRGDYHTGSNILVWRVLDFYSRIAREIWKDNVNAGVWSGKARECKSDILSKCIIPGPYGNQFAEGTWKNGIADSAARCHDGEEVAVVQSAFYGFVEQDNPLVLNHCQASMTPFNYLYNPVLNAMLWQDISYWSGGYTFPAWLVLIAGAANKSELLHGLDFWKTVTDVDGSPWWWPYDVGQTNPEEVNRRKCNFVGGFCDVAKVSYASGIFNTLLINNVLGLSADVHHKTFSFRPFSPWQKFEWQNGRIGNAFFDITYSDDGNTITATVINRNVVSYSGVIGLMVPENCSLKKGKTTRKRYGRDYSEIKIKVGPGEKKSFSITYRENSTHELK